MALGAEFPAIGIGSKPVLVRVWVAVLTWLISVGGLAVVVNDKDGTAVCTTAFEVRTPPLVLTEIVEE